MFAVQFRSSCDSNLILQRLIKVGKEILRYLVCFIKPLFKISSSILAFSILLGAVLLFYAPVPAKAGFFSSIFGDDALAQGGADSAQSNTNLQQNSQTMALLQANVSSASVLQGTNDTKDSKKDAIVDNSDLNIVSGNAILPATGPLGVSDGNDVLDPSSLTTSVYVVRKGDSITQIAKMFNVSANTILWANDIKKGEKLAEGDVLFILPVSGLEHTVTKGQTLQSIAKLYKADVSDIIIFNDLTPDTKLVVGDKLMIPGGEMFDEGGDKPALNLSSTLARDKKYYETHPLLDLLGFFINPVPTGRKTQGLHGPGNRGIDIGAPTGTPIYASASGTILVVKTGCKLGQRRCGGGYGNMAIVQHSNETKTLYGHMSKLAAHTGDQVTRGEIIGYVGSTGRSTGPHLHFEVFGAKNPGADWSWAN